MTIKATSSELQELRAAATNGTISYISKRLLTVENLIAKVDVNYVYSSDRAEWTALHWAVASGNLPQIPKGLLVRLKPEHLEISAQNKQSTWAPLHSAAINGHLKHIPKHLFSNKNLLQRSRSGYTVFHHAVEAGNLYQIPEEFLSLDNLTQEIDGWTAIHHAALFGHLKHIPRNLLTAEVLMMTDRKSRTILEVAAANNELDQLLGIQLPPAAINIVGDAWWERNLTALHEFNTKNIPMSKALRIENILEVDI